MSEIYHLHAVKFMLYKQSIYKVSDQIMVINCSYFIIDVNVFLNKSVPNAVASQFYDPTQNYNQVLTHKTIQNTW